MPDAGTFLQTSKSAVSNPTQLSSLNTIRKVSNQENDRRPLLDSDPSQASGKLSLPELEAELDAMMGASSNHRSASPPLLVLPPESLSTAPDTNITPNKSDLTIETTNPFDHSNSSQAPNPTKSPLTPQAPLTPKIEVSPAGSFSSESILEAEESVQISEKDHPPSAPTNRLSRFFTLSRRKSKANLHRDLSSSPVKTPEIPIADLPSTEAQDEWEKHAESLALSEPSTSPSGTKKGSRLSLFSNSVRSLRTSSEISINNANDTHSHDSLGLLSPTSASPLGDLQAMPREQTAKTISLTFSQSTDDRLQQAINLHEAGNLEKSALLFEELADPATINHPLAQVLCGLSYRHGWGVMANEERAFQYLRLAAGNSALVDQIVSAGETTANIKPNPNNRSKKGIAKGELVLSIYELGNCFRYGWGTPRDPVLAKQYYETAAKLGDLDAICETAWCYLTGFGIKKKDKFTAAQYYRMAENAGRVEVGNSWIW